MKDNTKGKMMNFFKIKQTKKSKFMHKINNNKKKKRKGKARQLMTTIT